MEPSCKLEESLSFARRFLILSFLQNSEPTSTFPKDLFTWSSEYEAMPASKSSSETSIDYSSHMLFVVPIVTDKTNTDKYLQVFAIYQDV